MTRCNVLLEITKWKLFSELKKWHGYHAICKLLSDDNTNIYLAGGALRNIIIGNSKIKDFDFFIKSKNKKDILNYLNEQGCVTYGPFGSARWYPKEESEVYCDLIWIDEFYNGLWKCEDIIDVLNQFDFTANAVAIDIRSGAISNPENGLRDIECKILRAVRFDYPNEPISGKTTITRLEVLWFRLLHYANKYNFKIDPVTTEWLQKNIAFSEQENEFERLFFKPDIRL